MEFLTGIERTQSLGLTNEEFMAIWKIESQLAMQTQEEATDSNIENTTTTAQSEQRYNELKQECNRHFQYLQNRLVAQEQRWEQLHTKLDHILTEVKFGYELVNTVVKNITDSNTHSLEVHFRQEIELLRQEFINHLSRLSHQVTSIIACQHGEADTVQHAEPATVQHGEPATVQHGEPATVQHGEPATVQNGTPPPIAPNISTAYTDTHDGSKCEQENTTCEAESNYKKNSVSLLHHHDAGLHETSVKNLSLCQQNIPEQDIHAVSRTLERNGQKPVKENSYAHAAIAKSVATSCDPIVATGSYAEAVLKQIEKNHSSQLGSVNSRSKVKNSNLPKNTTQNIPAGNDQQIFTIDNCKQFSVSDEPFISKAIYSTNRPCKAQVYITFEKTGDLAVRICIHKGIYDDGTEWPLWVSGSGYIWNTISKSPSQIWQLKPVLCKKPHIFGKEQVFTADVSLITLCRQYHGVKYQQLEKKHFTEGNKLIFRWTLRASEDKM